MKIYAWKWKVNQIKILLFYWKKKMNVNIFKKEAKKTLIKIKNVSIKNLLNIINNIWIKLKQKLTKI